MQKRQKARGLEFVRGGFEVLEDSERNTAGKEKTEEHVHFFKKTSLGTRRQVDDNGVKVNWKDNCNCIEL